jgi:type II secretory pathway component PulM
MFKMDMSEPGAKLVVLMGILASIVAGVAMAENDRVTAAWAGATLFSVGLWLVWPRPARQRRKDR